MELQYCTFMLKPAQTWTFPMGSALLKLICHEWTWITNVESTVLSVSLQWWIWTSWRRRLGCTAALLATSRCPWGRSWRERTPSSGRCVCWWNVVVETVPAVSRAAMSANACQPKSPKNTMRYAPFLHLHVWKCWKPVKEFTKMNAPVFIFYYFMYWTFSILSRYCTEKKSLPC